MAGKKDDRIENVVVENETGFYTFRQNNSGGSFDRDADVDAYVVVEGTSIQDVTARATEIGIYFNGCEDRHDCPCCGDRWYEPWKNEELDKVPSLYGSPLAGPFYDRRKKDSTVVIHYIDGTRAYGSQKCTNESLNQFPSLALYDKVK